MAFGKCYCIQLCQSANRMISCVMDEEAHGKMIQVRALDGLALPLGMIFQEFCRLTEPPPQPVAVSLSCPLPVSHKPRPFLLVMADRLPTSHTQTQG